MQVRFLLGPAGSGKTVRCVEEVRTALAGGAMGGRLLFLAPKQATFQIERQVVSGETVGGFTRLEILSFERLAQKVVEERSRTVKRLGEEGRTMVFRALLGREASHLRYFGKAARSASLAREVSNVLRTFQEHGIGSGRLESMSLKEALPAALRWKLGDWAVLLRRYQEWLAAAGMEDPSDTAWRAVDLLERGAVGLHYDAVWMDGFAEMTPVEVALLRAVFRRTERMTLAFCLDREAAASGRVPMWRVVERTFNACHAALASIPGVVPEVVELSRDPVRSRFGPGAGLGFLEERIGAGREPAMPETLGQVVRVVRCRDPHEEAEWAAARVLEAVTAGGRYRDVAVLVRSLEGYGSVLARTFRKRGIPCFVDQRHALRHHPLVELTRTALRLSVDPLSEEDWFAWLKCGLLPLEGWDAEELENRLRAERWAGRRWLMGGAGLDDGRLASVMERVTGPVRAFVRALSIPDGIDGEGLSEAIRQLWDALEIEERLEDWDEKGEGALRHRTVLAEMTEWLDEAARAFSGHPMPAQEWLPVVESAWNGLTAGAVPPSLDQVLIGAVDRSRNPELSWVILPGWVEGGFPAGAASCGLLSGTEREALEEVAEVGLGPTPLDRVHHEQFYGYIALTRSRGRVDVTFSSEGLGGEKRVPSAFLRRWLSEVRVEEAELAEVRVEAADEMEVGQERLTSAVAQRFWGGRLRTSASGLETMAGCRFAFFAGHVLRLREREEKEADAREEGSWAHDLLSAFHESLVREGRTWHSVDPVEGVERIRRLAAERRREEDVARAGVVVGFALARAERQAAEWIRHWLAVLAHWPGEPERVEMKFGPGSEWPELEVDVGEGRVVVLQGRVDRVDRVGEEADGRPRLWVVDYKRGAQGFDPARVEAGFDLQLPLYLEAVRRATGGVPVGMTYTSLKPERKRGKNRNEVSEGDGYRHRGRFDFWALDGVNWEALPFAVKLKKDGSPYAISDGVDAGRLKAVVDSALARASALGGQMLEGDVAAQPVRDGQRLPCDHCAYRAVCRIGPGEDS